MANYEHRPRNNRTESPLPMHINKSGLCQLYICHELFWTIRYIDEYHKHILCSALATQINCEDTYI